MAQRGVRVYKYASGLILVLASRGFRHSLPIMQRRSIGAFLVFTGAIVLCLWMGYEYSHRQSRSVAGSATELRPQPTQQILSATPSSIAAPSPSVETSGRTKEERMSQILEATSHQPIDFYGRVVDQTGAPVADADIRGNVEISRRWMDQTWEEHHTITDADGRFSFSGLHGQNLVVTPRKDGYSYKEATKDVFAYSALS